MSLAVIYAGVAYIGNKPFKRDTYYSTRLTFKPFEEQQVAVETANRMAVDCPDVYMITRDRDGEYTPEYKALLERRGYELENPEPVSVNKEPLDPVDAGVEIVKAQQSASVKQASDDLAAQRDEKINQFAVEVAQQPNKPSLVKFGTQRLGVELSENDYSRPELEEALRAEFVRQLDEGK